MGPEQAADFERELASPELYQVFAEALLVRALLKTPPPGPDERLPGRIMACLEEEEPRWQTSASRNPRGALGKVLESFGWIWRGPARGLAASSSGRTGLGGISQGVSTIRYALAPVEALGMMPSASDSESQGSNRSWWARVVRRTKG